jgi:hypothetical protein
MEVAPTKFRESALTKSKKDKHHHRALSNLLEKGLAAAALGMACLAAPALLGPQSTLAGMATALRVPGFIVLGLGLVLLGIRFSIQSRAKKLAAMPGGTYIRKSQYGDLEPLPYSPSGFPMARASSRVTKSARRRSSV